MANLKLRTLNNNHLLHFARPIDVSSKSRSSSSRSSTSSQKQSPIAQNYDEYLVTSQYYGQDFPILFESYIKKGGPWYSYDKIWRQAYNFGRKSLTADTISQNSIDSKLDSFTPYSDDFKPYTDDPQNSDRYSGDSDLNSDKENSFSPPIYSSND
jgi:hypothetical protein